LARPALGGALGERSKIIDSLTMERVVFDVFVDDGTFGVKALHRRVHDLLAVPHRLSGIA
jgi:hypothetical protein